mmetsp:Transcript_45207/g.121840  ORF Transcript_45207/g.121840 Transcript_45207/m.121840 type:complete len:311 (+) Transcript_45207:115-1047(+)
MRWPLGAPPRTPLPGLGLAGARRAREPAAPRRHRPPGAARAGPAGRLTSRARGPHWLARVRAARGRLTVVEVQRPKLQAEGARRRRSRRGRPGLPSPRGGPLVLAGGRAGPTEPGARLARTRGPLGEVRGRLRAARLVARCRAGGGLHLGQLGRRERLGRAPARRAAAGAGPGDARGEPLQLGEVVESPRSQGLRELEPDGPADQEGRVKARRGGPTVGGQPAQSGAAERPRRRAGVPARDRGLPRHRCGRRAGHLHPRQRRPWSPELLADDGREPDARGARHRFRALEGRGSPDAARGALPPQARAKPS